ncbi:hypothetical protein GO988_15525 [Hymenobacter sp. HMF4947]|uniref:Uncharacterized protein n=1 Tax=Hymenobacter ginkgonis TaxID=2682976 RepID=A0A7K1THC0_9BACT|nr:hypothetical protein [Hymenobacter ginkgonis]MVN77743.1 hypothetical protein [Hymenobacter ginkgonis]
MATTSIISLIGGVLFGLLGFLLKRTLDAVDKKMDSTCQKVDTACNAVNDMRMEMSGFQQLVQYLRADVVDLKGQNNSLREAHAHIDKHIAVLTDRRERAQTAT